MPYPTGAPPVRHLRALFGVTGTVLAGAIVAALFVGRVFDGRRFRVEPKNKVF
jgi:hypothetical protein